VSVKRLSTLFIFEHKHNTAGVYRGCVISFRVQFMFKMACDDGVFGRPASQPAIYSIRICLSYVCIKFNRMSRVWASEHCCVTRTQACPAFWKSRVALNIHLQRRETNYFELMSFCITEETRDARFKAFVAVKIHVDVWWIRTSTTTLHGVKTWKTSTGKVIQATHLMDEQKVTS